jgi:hypothetical protein
VLTLLQPGKADQVPTAESETARCMRCWAKGFAAGERRTHVWVWRWGFVCGLSCGLALLIVGKAGGVL